jgi:hypothetical protein
MIIFSEERGVTIPALVSIEHTRNPGQPRKILDADFLRYAVQRSSIPFIQLARAVGVHRHTLSRRMKECAMSRKYSNISDNALDTLIRNYKKEKPGSGLQYIIGCIRSKGLRIQEERIRMSLQRVDLLGKTLRARHVIHRRQYAVGRPNALWHMDGHHKLIRWGIVIHGFIDGYCRTVSSTSHLIEYIIQISILFQIIALRASSNNKAITVLDLFLQGIEAYGLPSRVRGDRGGENIDVATYMVMKNGPRRGSFLWGT